MLCFVLCQLTKGVLEDREMYNDYKADHPIEKGAGWAAYKVS